MPPGPPAPPPPPQQRGGGRPPPSRAATRQKPALPRPQQAYAAPDYAPRPPAATVSPLPPTVQSAFGTGRLVDGFFLDNRLPDFSFDPRRPDGKPSPNAVAAGKRPRSSMVPLILLDRDGKFAGAIGSASARVMVASVAQEEDLGLDEVLDILDEATQVRAYSRELEVKQHELEEATADLREANERLRELDRMKDDFISTVTHELRTPLTSIRALSEMLHEDPKLELSDRKRFLGIIVNEAERLTRLINQILDMAKMESGRAEWTTSAVDIGEVARESMDSLGQLFREKDVALTSDIPPDIPVVLADRDRLTQVMINLLSNAVKFVPGGSGRVNVKVSADDQFVRIEVADNGPGLTAEEGVVIFEKFRQGGNTMTDKPQGTGLGLPISRQIVEYFGGNLWVESQPGAGANFIFTVPLPAPEE